MYQTTPETLTVTENFNLGRFGEVLLASEGRTEFERQSAKIVSAIAALDADVVGLIETENDGDGAESAIAKI